MVKNKVIHFFCSNTVIHFTVKHVKSRQNLFIFLRPTLQNYILCLILFLSNEMDEYIEKRSEENQR